LPVNRVSAVPRTLQSGHASPMRGACGLPRSAWAKGGGAARSSRASAGTILAPPLHGFFNGEAAPPTDACFGPESACRPVRSLRPAAPRSAGGTCAVARAGL